MTYIFRIVERCSDLLIADTNCFSHKKRTDLISLSVHESYFQIWTRAEFLGYYTNFILILSSAAFNPFPNKPWFLRVYSTSLLKTQREKEKLLVTSNFSFSHSVFCPFGKLFLLFSSSLKL